MSTARRMEKSLLLCRSWCADELSQSRGNKFDTWLKEIAMTSHSPILIFLICFNHNLRELFFVFNLIEFYIRLTNFLSFQSFWCATHSKTVRSKDLVASPITYLYIKHVSSAMLILLHCTFLNCSAGLTVWINIPRGDSGDGLIWNVL